MPSVGAFLGQCRNSVGEYSTEKDKIMQNSTDPFIRKNPNLSSRKWDLSSVAGIGFEPTTFGL